MKVLTSMEKGEMTNAESLIGKRRLIVVNGRGKPCIVKMIGPRIEPEPRGKQRSIKITKYCHQ
jgi:hypothetical protein